MTHRLSRIEHGSPRLDATGWRTAEQARAQRHWHLQHDQDQLQGGRDYSVNNDKFDDALQAETRSGDTSRRHVAETRSGDTSWKKIGYCKNIECATRKDAGLRIIECIQEMRADPELYNPNISTFVLLDPAGEWGMEYTKVQQLFKEQAGIITCVRPTAADKRLMGHAEHTVKQGNDL